MLDTPRCSVEAISIELNVILRIVRCGISRFRNTAWRTAEATAGAGAGVEGAVLDELEAFPGKVLLLVATGCLVVALIIVLGGRELIASPSASFFALTTVVDVCQANEADVLA